MNGCEVEAITFSHQFARHTDNPEIKQALALSRRVEAQQQKAVNGLNPGDQTPLATTIGYEQVAADLTSWLAPHEPAAVARAARGGDRGRAGRGRPHVGAGPARAGPDAQAGARLRAARGLRPPLPLREPV